MKVIRTILFILNVLLALGLVATTLGGMLPPSRSVLPSLVAYGYLTFLAANVPHFLHW